MPGGFLPYIVYGTVYNTDGTTGIGSGVTITIRNETNNETQTTTTDSNSRYIFDAANFASGYLATDTFTVFVIYTNLEGSGTVTVASDTHTLNITLTSVTTNTAINYTTIQKVWDQLGGLTSSDISARRVLDAIQRSEREIEDFAQTKFVSTTVTQEIYDWNEYTTWKSPEMLRTFNGTDRYDYRYINYNNKIKLKKSPIISITTLQRNTASSDSTDSWSTLTEQTGTGGDYTFEANTAIVSFQQNWPRYGQRAMRVTYVYGYSSVPKSIERLTTLLAAKEILLSQMNNSLFTSSDSFSLEGISMTKSNVMSQYIKTLNEEIYMLWDRIPVSRSEVV